MRGVSHAHVWYKDQANKALTDIAEDALVFVAGYPPIYGKKIRYYVDPVFGARATIPPPLTSDRIAQEVSPWTARVSPAAA